MEVFHGLTADDAWCQLHKRLSTQKKNFKIQKGRRGNTIELLHCALEIKNPTQRWIVSRTPAINPAFGIAEIFWILAGSNDAHVLNYWFPGLPVFAGKGKHYPGAYGYRLREHFKVDQIRRACDVLNSDPTSRQVVLQLWDVNLDLPERDGSPRNEDIPCNLFSLLKVRDGQLEWTQIMRSNDFYRGLPYNILQFTTLQEIIAGWVGVKVGTFHHIIDSLHIYISDIPKFSCTTPNQIMHNTDSLMLDVDRGESIIHELYSRTVDLTKPSISNRDLDVLVSFPDAPLGYQNLLYVLGAEAARRRLWHDQAIEIMGNCTNDLIVQAWRAWWDRVFVATNSHTS